MYLSDKEKEKFIKRLFNNYKRNAKRRGHSFELPLEVFGEMVQQDCGYCGADASNKISSKGKFFRYNGIDRMDSRVGYTIENVVPCCRFCNSIKGSMPWVYWQDFINDVVELYGGQKPFPGVRSRDRSSKSFYKGR